MFSALRKFVVIFLARLQLFAPLVNAHTGEKISDLRLHVPGLEMYGIANELKQGAKKHLNMAELSFSIGAAPLFFISRKEQLMNKLGIKSVFLLSTLTVKPESP